MKKYFFLNRESILVPGRNSSAIYNLYTGKIFATDTTTTKFLNFCETPKLSIEDIFNKYDDFNKADILQELHHLEKLGLGDFYHKRVIIEKIKSPYQKQKNRTKFEPPALMKLTIELTNRCNLNCLFCGHEEKKINKCGCWRHSANSSNKNLSIAEWKNIIDEALLFNCNSIKISGGEPFLEIKNILRLINFSEKRKIPSTEIWTNASLLTDEIIDQLSKSIKLVIPFFSVNKEIHEKITGYKNSYDIIVKNLQKIIKSKIKLKIDLLINDINYDSKNETIKFLARLGVRNISITYLTMELFKKDKNSEYLFVSGAPRDRFFKNKEGHPCWDGQLAITYYGDVLPCILARNYKIANVIEKPLREILRSKDYQLYWDLSKDKIDGCKDCELRYGCHDCRLLYTSNGSLCERNIYCEYLN